MFAKIHILIENTPWSTAMPEGTGTSTVWAHNRFLAYGRQMCVAKFTHHTVVYRHVYQLYILTAPEGR